MVESLSFDSRHNVLPGKHFYQFYKNTDDFLSIMIPFFQAGLEKKEACLWLISEKNGLSFCRDTAEAIIFNFTHYVSIGQLVILPAENWYLTDGAFDEAKSIQNAERYFETFRENGFTRFRGAGDGGFLSRRDWPIVEAYERKIGPWLKANSITGLCAYPILEFTPSQAKAILDCHEDVLVGRL